VCVSLNAIVYRRTCDVTHWQRSLCVAQRHYCFSAHTRVTAIVGLRRLNKRKEGVNWPGQKQGMDFNLVMSPRQHVETLAECTQTAVILDDQKSWWWWHELVESLSERSSVPKKQQDKERPDPEGLVSKMPSLKMSKTIPQAVTHIKFQLIYWAPRDQSTDKMVENVCEMIQSVKLFQMFSQRNVIRKWVRHQMMSE
jgi:hypothetical protein